MNKYSHPTEDPKVQKELQKGMKLAFPDPSEPKKPNHKERLDELEKIILKLIKRIDDLEQRHRKLIKHYNRHLKSTSDYIKLNEKNMDNSFEYLMERIERNDKMILELWITVLKITLQRAPPFK